MTAANWVERNTGRTLTEDQERAVTVLATTASNGQVYNVPLIGSWNDAQDHRLEEDPYCEHDGCTCPATPPVEFHDHFIIARLRGELATFDGSALTRLVVAAHDHAVRVSLAATTAVVIDPDAWVMERNDEGEWVETDRHPLYRQPCLEVMLHPRQREGSTFERHPTLAQAIEPHRNGTHVITVKRDSAEDGA